MNSTSKAKKRSKKPFDYLRYRVEVIDHSKSIPTKKISNMNFIEPNRIIKAIINEKQIRQGKSGKDYLLLKLANQEAIFVFDNKDTPQASWTELTEGEKYTFTVKEGLNGSNILVGFELDLFS